MHTIWTRIHLQKFFSAYALFLASAQCDIQTLDHQIQLFLRKQILLCQRNQALIKNPHHFPSIFLNEVICRRTRRHSAKCAADKTSAQNDCRRCASACCRSHPLDKESPQVAAAYAACKICHIFKELFCGNPAAKTICNITCRHGQHHRTGGNRVTAQKLRQIFRGCTAIDSGSLVHRIEQ